MDNAPPPSDQVEDAARTQRHLLVLDELVETGLDLVRRTRAAPIEAADQVAVFDQAERCQRLVHSVRRTIALAAWIARDRRLAAGHRQRQAAEAETARRGEQKRSLHHKVELAIQQAPRARFPDLRYRLTQRLNDWDIENDIAHHDIEAAIARLCTEFGIAPPPDAILPAAAAPRPESPGIQPLNAALSPDAIPPPDTPRPFT